MIHSEGEQPLITVKDYRPSFQSSNSSEASESTDDFEYEVEKPCPFAQIPKKSKMGKLYVTRCLKGRWRERPIVTTLETPFRLRCWAINGPNEDYDENDEQTALKMDENTGISMTGLSVLNSQPHLHNGAPKSKAPVGKMSPLQKNNIRIAHPSRREHPSQYRGAPMSCTRARALDVSEMLNADARCVEEPIGLSGSSSENETQLDLTCVSLSSRSDSSSVNFCLDSGPSSPDDERFSNDFDALSDQDKKKYPALSQESIGEALQVQRPENSDTNQSQADTLTLAEVQTRIDSLTQQVEQLMSLANSLQDQLTVCDKEILHFQQEIQSWKTPRSSSEDCTSSNSSAAQTFPSVDDHGDSQTQRSSFMTNRDATEGERLRMELMEQGQKTAKVLLENEMLLGVILRLKCEMDVEHDLYQKVQKKADNEQSATVWNKLRKVMRSPCGFTDSKKRSAYHHGWVFGRSRNRKPKRSGT